MCFDGLFRDFPLYFAILCFTTYRRVVIHHAKLFSVALNDNDRLFSDVLVSIVNGRLCSFPPPPRSHFFFFHSRLLSM